jgi:hypothetical protein
MLALQLGILSADLLEQAMEQPVGDLHDVVFGTKQVTLRRPWARAYSNA